MRQEDRKAAIAAYRERKAASGIYLLRCRASGESWAGHAPDLATIRNRLWFTLRQQSHRHHELQAAIARAMPSSCKPWRTMRSFTMCKTRPSCPMPNTTRFT